MPENKRSYRKTLTTKGLIYIADEEIEISVRNLSITGLLAELGDNPKIKDIKALFDAIKKSPKVDIYLPKMKVIGEAEVARVDLVEDHLYIALEFSNISYDVDDVLYKRKAYRKELVAPGSIVLNGKKYAFTTTNVSVRGLMIHLKERVKIKEGTITVFEFKHLDLLGQIKVAWTEEAEDGGTFMGLEYVHLEKSAIKGIPEFKH